MTVKGYVLGFSSGLFGVSDARERESFLTMPRKFFKGSLEGVNFTQVDIDSITEFKEPYLQDGIRRMKDMKLRLGFHGESYATSGVEKPIGQLDSCLQSQYVHAHERLIDHIEGCGKLGGEYVNIHPSETSPFITLGEHLQPAKLVDPWGRSFEDFFKENENTLKWTIKAVREGTVVASHLTDYVEQYVSHEMREKLDKIKDRNLTEEEKEESWKEGVKKAINRFTDSNQLEYGAERIAYLIIAHWLQENNDELWKNIVHEKITDEELMNAHKKWVPAVSAKYIWGHFNPKDTKKYPDPKPMLKDYELYFAFESQMGSGGIEGLYRLMHPMHMAYLCKSIGSPWVITCFDFEHVLSQNIDPKEEIKSFPEKDNLGQYIKLCHLGWPTTHPTAHMPIPLGSEAQIYLYKRLYELKQKGMKDAYIIYERGGAERDTTMISLRMMKHYLDLNVPPKDLPLHFFGMDEKGPNVRRQEETIRDHFFDPLKGMLQFPEEEYTFLSKAATEKGKGEVWKKEQYR